MGEPVSTAVRVGVVGAGAMGAAHVETLARWVPGAEVVAVYDADPGRADVVAGAVGAVAASSAEALIGDDSVDAVLVAAPDPTHEELALACLAAGKPTLLEKPLATSVEGARRVVDAEVAGGRRLLQLGFMRRFDPAYVALREAVLGGEVGEPRAAHCLHRNVQAHPTATSDGVLVNSAIHEFDCVPWLLDDRVTAVTVFAPAVPAGALQDVQVVVLELARGPVVTVEVSVNARYGYDIHTEVVGTGGTVSLTPPYGLSFRREAVDGRHVDADFVGRFLDAYRVELAAWVDGIAAGTVPGPSAWDGHLANVVAFAAVESLHTGTRVAVPPSEMPALYG
ncbi:MAG TPA: Gfo/Idh/MocA family oxidoreductase [Marmoricola sp.]|nr:Gfo/Idh/MocA family oxidoreductase [Marmoricola sp.]